MPPRRRPAQIPGNVLERAGHAIVRQQRVGDAQFERIGPGGRRSIGTVVLRATTRRVAGPRVGTTNHSAADGTSPASASGAVIV